MANTYTQLHVQFVFAPKFRRALIEKPWKPDLHKYITGIIQNNGHKMLQVNSMPDHIHIFLGLRPQQSVSALMQNVKTESTKWINANSLCRQPFQWQEGYGAFSYCKAEVPAVIAYIQNQEIHHQAQSFNEEYRQLLDEFEVEFDPRYLFHDPLD